MKIKYLFLTIATLTVMLLIIDNFQAVLDTTRQNRLEFGHVLMVNSIYSDPVEISPGSVAKIKGTVENTGTSFIQDLRIKLTLPNEIAFYNDVSEKRIARMDSLKTDSFEFNVIVLPSTSEGIYKGSLTIDYINRVGEERQDTYSVGFIVKSTPKMYAKIEETELYQGNNVGKFTITIVNNNEANVKFLSVELQESENYKIISSNNEYIGDLDSDDFGSASYKLKVDNNLKEVKLPIKLIYKDSLNKDYSEDFILNLELMSPEEIGKSKNNSYLFIIIIIIILIVIFIYHRKYKKSKHKKDGF
jgi:hypothetical protein